MTTLYSTVEMYHSYFNHYPVIIFLNCFQLKIINCTAVIILVAKSLEHHYLLIIPGLLIGAGTRLTQGLYLWIDVE